MPKSMDGAASLRVARKVSELQPGKGASFYTGVCPLCQVLATLTGLEAGGLSPRMGSGLPLVAGEWPLRDQQRFGLDVLMSNVRIQHQGPSIKRTQGLPLSRGFGRSKHSLTPSEPPALGNLSASLSQMLRSQPLCQMFPYSFPSTCTKPRDLETTGLSALCPG